jgi:hypothetical protein
MNLEGLFVAWAKEFSGLPANRVLVADTNFIRPELPYVTIKIASQDNFLWSERVRSETTTKTRINATGILTVNAYGPGASDVLYHISHALHSESGEVFSSQNKFAIWQANDMVNLSSLVDTDIEERHVRDFNFRYTYEPTEGSGFVALEYYEIDAEFNEREFEIIAPENDLEFQIETECEYRI